MTDEFAALRSALEAGPTPGPWIAVGDEFGGDINTADGDYIAQDHEGLQGSVRSGQDLAYIAAADPDTIRRLLAAYDARGAALKLAERAIVQQDGGDVWIEVDVLPRIRAAIEKELEVGVNLDTMLAHDSSRQEAT